MTTAKTITKERATIDFGVAPPMRIEKRVHFVGIGGIGMSALASLLQHEGCQVSGSDVATSEQLQNLVAAGVPIELGPTQDSSLPADIDSVVHTAAVGPDHPLLAGARARNLPIRSYAEALSMLCADRQTTAIAGTHGKTTTAAMLAVILRHAGLSPGAVIGGLVPDLGGNALWGEGAPFVVEACEYRESFHELAPRFAVVTNVGSDHMDYYGTEDRLRSAFREFVGKVAPKGLVLTTARVARDLDLRGAYRGRILTIGPKRRDIRIHLDDGQSGMSFRIAFPGGDTTSPIRLALPGRHNIMNAAMAAVIAIKAYKVAPEVVVAALEAFQGVQRRYQVLRQDQELVIIDDYAHHPDEIEATLLATRQRFPGRRIVAVFQPHLESRTRHHFAGFLNALSFADELALLNDYRVAGREQGQSEQGEIATGAAMLVDGFSRLGMSVPCFENLGKAALRLAGLKRSGDVLVLMGAGDIGRLSHDLAR